MSNSVLPFQNISVGLITTGRSGAYIETILWGIIVIRDESILLLLTERFERLYQRKHLNAL